MLYRLSYKGMVDWAGGAIIKLSLAFSTVPVMLRSMCPVIFRP